MDKNFLAQLKHTVGEAYVLTGDEHTATYAQDWRKRYSGKPYAVVLPSNREEVIRLVQLAADHRIPIVPQGGNTSTCGGATCDDSRTQLIVNLRRLQRLITFDADNATLTVEAGVTLQKVRAYAAQQKRMFPLSLASEGTCQIGGNLATNAGGLSVLRYGTMRDLTAGLEVVLPNGQVINALTGLHKDTSGLDIKQFFIGSEGQLGIITAATLKLFPAPTATATALVGVHDITSAIHWLNTLKQAFDGRLTTCEIMSQESLRLAQHYQTATVPFITPWALLIELSDTGHSVTLADQLTTWLHKQTALLEAVVASNAKQRSELWQLRESLSYAQQRLGPSIKHDIAVPIGAIPEFVERTNNALKLAYPDCKIVVFGHVGDGNLHYNVSYTRPENRDLFDDEAQVNKIVYDIVYSFGGTLAAEHGIGQLKTAWLEHYKDPVALALMRDIKRLIDPNNLMNPGKWLTAT